MHDRLDAAEVATGPAVALRDVTVRYGAVTALDGLDIDIEGGKITALLGANGAGKTTAVRLMLGLITPVLGAATLFGLDPRQRKARARVGAMMQVARVPEMLRVAEHIDTFRSYYPRPLPRAELIEMAGLAGFERRMFGTLSGGEKQRVLFALALTGDPEFLFLDEPTVGMDVETRRAFWKQIRSLRDRGRGVLLTTHYLEEADALADRVIVINHGKVAADGSPAVIKQSLSRRRIRCSTVLTDAEIMAIAGVDGVEREGERVSIAAAAPEDVLRVMLSRDLTLHGLEVSDPGLEEAFIALTTQPSQNGSLSQ